MTALRKFMSLLVIVCLVAAMVPAASAADANVIAVWETESLPVCWNPLEALSEDEKLLQNLTGSGLYTVSNDGTMIHSQLAAMPEDVTAEYAGSYGVPQDAVRGYAYRIAFNDSACWDDGTAITADDWMATAYEILKDEDHQTLQILANAEGYRNGATHDPEVVSLAAAGYGSVTEAQEAGITQFYVDVENYWGLGDGWMPVDNTQRIRDFAMPKGYAEMYVSPALLYNRYLAPEKPYAYFQSEFLGIAGEAEGAVLTLEDVGLVKTGDYEMVMILQEPETATSLAAKLKDFVLVREGYNYRSVEKSASYGPYRIAEVTEENILLEQNPNWWGEAGQYEQILCR